MRVPTVCIAITAEMDVARAVLETRRISVELGFASADQSRVATAASELARNILKYAGAGHVTIASLQRDGRVGIERLGEQVIDRTVRRTVQLRRSSEPRCEVAIDRRAQRVRRRCARREGDEEAGDRSHGSVAMDQW